MSGAAAANLKRKDGQPPEMGWTRTLGRLAEGRNINPETLLATDYLNHFNEIAMLIEMAGDMPECVEDIAEWEPLDYAAHFRNSAFADKELAILAYENAPAKHREPFDTVVDQANRIAGEAALALIEAGKNLSPTPCLKLPPATAPRFGG